MKTKHHYIRKLIFDGWCKLVKIPSKQNTADMMTKILPASTVSVFSRILLGLPDILNKGTDSDCSAMLTWLCIMLCQVTIGGLCQILYTLVAVPIVIPYIIPYITCTTIYLLSRTSTLYIYYRYLFILLDYDRLFIFRLFTTSKLVLLFLSYHKI